MQPRPNRRKIKGPRRLHTTFPHCCHRKPNDQCIVKLTSQSPPSQPSASVITRRAPLSVALYNVRCTRVIATTPSTTSHPPLSDWPSTEAATRVVTQGLPLANDEKAGPRGGQNKARIRFRCKQSTRRESWACLADLTSAATAGGVK